MFPKFLTHWIPGGRTKRRLRVAIGAIPLVLAASAMASPPASAYSTYPYSMSLSFVRNTADHTRGTLKLQIRDDTGRTVVSRTFRAGSGLENGNTCSKI